jgi:formylglycine-generating enzyme required for sulfatase activity
MTAPRLLISHDAADLALAQALALDARAAGVDVWLDERGLGWAELRVALDQEMPTRPVFVAIVSPEALASPNVQLAVTMAAELARTHEVRERVALVARPCAIPATLADLEAVDATRDRGAAISTVLARLGIVANPDAPAALVPVSHAAPALPPTPSTAVLPPRFGALGYKGWQAGEREFILPPLCLVPGGLAMIGGTEDPAEAPVHRVDLSTFAIATYPVLVAEYACYVRFGHRLPPDVGRITWSLQFSRLDHPVVNVSWQDATEYAAWLSGLTGQVWRLPSEVEWEKAAAWDAARGQARRYPWGEQFASERCDTRESTLGATTAAGTYPNGASPCGVQDMAGNVREWTRSRYAQYPYDATDGREDMKTSGDRVQRGGSWFGFASDARCAFREWHASDEVSPVVGFRLLLEAPPGAGGQPAPLNLPRLT